MMRLKELRKNKGLLQAEIAKSVDLSVQTYSSYETGSRTPDYNTLIKLADYFNVTTDYLLGRTSDNIFENSYIPKSEIQEVYDELDELEQAQVLSFAKTLASYKKNSLLSTKRDRNIG